MTVFLKKTSKGFTAIEMLITVAIIGVLSTVILYPLSSQRTVRTLDGAKLKTLSALERARSLTLASKNSLQYGVYFATSTIAVFSGSTYSQGAVVETAPVPTGVEIVSINFAGGREVLFDRLTAETSDVGSLKLRLIGTNSSTTVSVYQTGIAE